MNTDMDDLLIKSFNHARSIPIDLGECVDTVINPDEIESTEIESSTELKMEEHVVEKPTFSVGDFVRCTYDDGIDYEAKIIYINDSKKTCRIRYFGYDNEQTVQLEALVSTWGEEARENQIVSAKAEKVANEVNKKKTKIPKGFNPPPVPPIPPMLFDSDDEEKNQQFAQLLISWFMTGYYTGLHQRSMQDSTKLKK